MRCDRDSHRPPRVRRPLQRRLFLWFGASILATGLTVILVSHVVARSGAPSWWTEVERVKSFAGRQFARAWNDPARRDELARAMARDLELRVVVVDSQRRQLAAFGGRCPLPSHEVPVRDDRGTVLGHVGICADRYRSGGGWRLAIPLLFAGVVLWAASGALARRLSRPLVDLVNVARDLGAGRLSSRARLRCDEHGEVRVLAEAINDMAARIERQLADQRELLAAVSHELRTPLGHIRLLVELAREGGADPRPLDELDREVVEMDALVGQLLASARLDFTALTMSALDAAEIARRALERAGEEPARLMVEAEDTAFTADATLVTRALANLVDNAKRHGGGLTALRVKGRPGVIAFEVEDSGGGFAPGEEDRVFQAFYRRPRGAERDGSLGLGLALVKRIAEAHGGRAYAENREEGGARVGIELPVAAAAES